MGPKAKPSSKQSSTDDCDLWRGAGQARSFSGRFTKITGSRRASTLPTALGRSMRIGNEADLVAVLGKKRYAKVRNAQRAAAEAV